MVFIRFICSIQVKNSQQRHELDNGQVHNKVTTAYENNTVKLCAKMTIHKGNEAEQPNYCAHMLTTV